MTKNGALSHAIDVAKEAARGGHGTPHQVLQLTYDKIVEIADGIKE